MVEVGDRLITIDHDYTNFTVRLYVHHCRHVSGEPQTIECDEIRWVTLDEIDQFTFPQSKRTDYRCTAFKLNFNQPWRI